MLQDKPENQTNERGGRAGRQKSALGRRACNDVPFM